MYGIPTDAGTRKEERNERIGRNDLLLYYIGTYCYDLKDRRMTKDRICEDLNLRRDTLNRNISRMRKSGLIQKEKWTGLCGYRLTTDGRTKYDRVSHLISDTLLDPGRCHLDTPILMDTVLRYTKDPVIKSTIIGNVILKRDFDLMALVAQDRAQRQGSIENILMEQLITSKGSIGSLDALIRKYSLVGIKGQIKGSTIDPEYIGNEVIKAQIKCRNGQYEVARHIYKMILKDRSRYDPTYTALAIAGYINLCKTTIGQEHALDMCDDFLGHIHHRAYRNLILKCKADILSDRMETEVAMSIYSSILRSSRAIRIPAIEVQVLNNMAVHRFRIDQMSLAKKDLDRACRIAKSNHMIWPLAVISTNLADCYGLIGKYRKAHDLLNAARKTFHSIDDGEGISGVDFNLALVLIEEGRKDEAMKAFRKCMMFDLVYTHKKEERRRVFDERIRKKGWAIQVSL